MPVRAETGRKEAHVVLKTRLNTQAFKYSR